MFTRKQNIKLYSNKINVKSEFGTPNICIVFERTKTFTKFPTTFPVPSIIVLVSHPVMIHHSVAAFQISPSDALLLILVGKQGETLSPVK
jgi:hypothetical protein